MNDQRGGIISKLIALPVGLALMAGFFFLGYFVGKYQSKSALADKPLALPEIAEQYLPKKEDFTFYKTLTDKEDKAFSIDLKPKQAEEDKAEKKEGAPSGDSDKTKKQRKPEKQIEIKIEKSDVPEVKQTARKPPAIQAKKDSVSKTASNAKERYTIQIASYPEKDMAEDEMKKMKKRGYAAFIVTSELQDKGTWYRVRLGSFSNKTAAEKLANELKSKEGLSPFVTIE